MSRESGVECEADDLMNLRAELLQYCREDGENREDMTVRIRCRKAMNGGFV